MSVNNSLTNSNPFPGLRSFRPEEGHLFFGRMESTARVVSRLIDNRFVAVIGASGSGKSSLVLSGVIPALMNEESKDKKKWSFVVLRPELHPIDNLANQLSALSGQPGFSYIKPDAVAASLHNRTEGIIDIVNKMRKNLRQQVLIVVDQFEEIFRYSPASTRGVIGDEATDFIDLLVNAAHQPEHGLFILLTLRSEYVSECSRFHSLTNLLNSGSYLLPQLTLETMTSVIEEPIKISGAAIDRSLLKTILGDITDRPGQLPVLQHLLMRLWGQWSKSGDMSRPISIADYEAVGKLKGAISLHAGQAYNSLDSRHKYVCARLFRSITMRTEDGKEIRKPEQISTVAALTGCTTEEIKRVADVFRSPEYSFLTPVSDIPLEDSTIIDLTHESIIKLWGTLRKWMEDEITAQKLYLQLAAAASVYQEGKGRLWSPPELLVALKWRNENNPTLTWAEKLDPAYERAMLFLKNSEQEYNSTEEHTKALGKKKIKRSRFYIGMLAILALLCLITVGAVMTLRAKAERERETALLLTDRAIASNIRLNDTLQTVIRSAEEINEGAREAVSKAQVAENKASSAEKMAEKAVTEKELAVSMAAEEKRRKMISVARSLAVRSLTHPEDQDIQILLAWQGYIFNKRHEGTANDADLFAALYNIGKHYGNRYYTSFKVDSPVITAMTVEPSGKIFYTADTDGRVMRWQVDYPDSGYNLVWSGDKIIETMTVSPGADWLACGTNSSDIVMIPLKENEMGFQVQGVAGEVTALSFSADGNHLFSASGNGAVTDWELASRKGTEIGREKAGITLLEVSPDNRMLAAVTADGKALLWKLYQSAIPVIVRSDNRPVTSMGFVPWEGKIIIADATGTIEVWDGSSLEKTDSYSGHSTGVTNIAFNDVYRQMITADAGGKLKIWNMEDLTETPALIDDINEGVISMRIISGGNAFLTATGSTLTGRPAHVENMVTDLCSKVTRNMTMEEWYAFVGRDIEYEKSCQGKEYHIRVNEIISAY